MAPTFPARSLEECNAILTAPGMPWELHDVDVRGRTLKVYKNVPATMRDLWLGSKVHGDRDYIVYQDERYTFSVAHKKVEGLASLLYHKYGVRKGDRVAICCRNLPEWVFLFWALQLLGGVPVAVNCWLPVSSIVHCLTYTTPRLVFLDEERVKLLTPHLNELREVGGTSAIFSIRIWGDPASGTGLVNLHREAKTYENTIGFIPFPTPEIHPDDVATLFFTSGTTGLPKGVCGTHRGFVHNIINTGLTGARAILRRGEDLPAPDPSAPQKSLLLTTPLFHIMGAYSSLGVGTFGGFKLVLMYKWDISIAASIILRERITNTGGIPYMVMDLLESVFARSGDEGHALESISYGGAPSSSGLPESIVKKLGQAVQPSQGYGATEFSSMATGVGGEDFLLRPTSAGLPTLVCQVKIVDEHDRELPVGSVGDILLAGVTRALCYWRSPEATRETFTEDGYYRSGDVGYVDKEGFLYIVDRAKDLIIRGGENISSITIETALYADARVLDVAVVPVPDPKLGELVSAAVVLKPSFIGKVTEDELKKLVASTLPRHVVPVLIVFMDVLPRNGVGKSDKRVLKAAMAKVWEEKQNATAHL